MAVGAAESNSGVVADDLADHHGGGLAQNRVDLTRHDGGARLQIREMDLRKAGEWAGAHHTNVVGNLVEGDSNGAHGAGELDEGVAGSLGLEVVLGLGELVNVGELLELLGDLAAKLSVGVQAGTGSGAADSQLTQARQGGLNALDAELDLASVAAEFLAQGDRGGVH